MLTLDHRDVDGGCARFIPTCWRGYMLSCWRGSASVLLAGAVLADSVLAAAVLVVVLLAALAVAVLAVLRWCAGRRSDVGKAPPPIFWKANTSRTEEVNSGEWWLPGGYTLSAPTRRGPL